MKLAVTIWKNRISPLFDSSRRLQIVDIRKRCVAGVHSIDLDIRSAADRASALAALGVDLLICGAISSEFLRRIQQKHIDIIPFVSGTLDEVIEAYLSGTLVNGELSMPGCTLQQL